MNSVRPEGAQAANPDGKTVFRALLITGQFNGAFDNDVARLSIALEVGGAGNPDANGGREWTFGRIFERKAATRKEIENALSGLLEDGTPEPNKTDPIKNADADDLTLIYLGGHGGKFTEDKDPTKDEKPGDIPIPPTPPDTKTQCQNSAPPPDGKGTQCDESFKLQDGSVLDDDLPALFKTIQGTKVYILDACFSAALSERDGSRDLPQDGNAVMLLSSGVNERSFYTDGDQPFGSARSYFAGYIGAGLSRDPAGNFARADLKPSGDENGEVTVNELFQYARDKTKALSNNAQNPEDLRLDTLGNTVVFRYKKENLVKSTVGTVAGNQKAKCEDCADGGCPVGGLGEPLGGSSSPARLPDHSSSPGDDALPVAAAIGGIAFALAGGAWYVRRRRWLR
ncbi:MAG TPA: hypothetical protein VFT91_04455 [Dehalococcoidia bacterium]|nr:hypothetical protein [Dehalococcoidia bacterium]